jgi:hypothetical protein
VLCATLAILADNSLGSDTSGILFAGVAAIELPTAWEGTLLVLPVLVVPVLVPAAGVTISGAIPCDDALCGLPIYVQLIEVDPGASRGLSFTPGLALRLGVR